MFVLNHSFSLELAFAIAVYVSRRKVTEKKQFYPATDRQLNRLAQNSKSENFFEKQ